MHAPSDWVIRFLPGIRQGGRVLDLACGQGRHFGPCLVRGLSVVGVDRDITIATSRHAGRPGLELMSHDLEDGRPLPFAAGSFAAVIVTNYLYRPILPEIVGLVAADGILIYETFGIGNARYGRPRSPDFLLRPEELLDAVHGRLKVVCYEHATLAAHDRVVQRIAAVGPDHRWPGDDPPRT